MKQNSTHELLVRHLYGETLPSEREVIARELAMDESLHQELEDLLEVKRRLDGDMRQPSETSLRLILEYSDRTGHLQES